MPWKGEAIASMAGAPEYWGYNSRSPDVRWTAECPVSREEAQLTHLSSKAAGKARQGSALNHHDDDPWDNALYQAAPSGANVPARMSSRAAGKHRQNAASGPYPWQGSSYQAASSGTNIPDGRTLGSARLPVESNIPDHTRSSLSAHSHGSSLQSLSNPNPSQQVVSSQDRARHHAVRAHPLVHSHSMPSTSDSGSVPSLASGVGNIIQRSHSTQPIRSTEAFRDPTQSFRHFRSTQAY